MSTPRQVAPTLALCLALLTAGCAGPIPGLDSAPESAFEESSVDSIRTTEPRCDTPRSANVSSVSRPVPGGRKLSIETTIPIRSRDTELEASLRELGPHRFALAIERTDGSGVPECYLEVQYNVTVNLTDEVTDRYTLVVTYDDVLVATYFADPDGSGAGHGLVPESRYAPWVRNVTDDGGVGDRAGEEGNGGSGSAVGSGGGGRSGGGERGSSRERNDG